MISHMTSSGLPAEVISHMTSSGLPAEVISHMTSSGLPVPKAVYVKTCFVQCYIDMLLVGIVTIIRKEGHVLFNDALR